MKLINMSKLGILRVDVQNRELHRLGTAGDWHEATPYCFVYPGLSAEVPVSNAVRAVVSLRAIERGVDPTAAIGIESHDQVSVQVETHGEKDRWTRKSVEHHVTRAAPYLTLADRVVIESARS